jgi:hypothetical protein
VCMIDELRDLTSHLIDTFYLSCFTTCCFSVSFLLHGSDGTTPTSIFTQYTISEPEQRRGPAPAVPEGASAIGRQKGLRKMPQKWGCAKCMETYTTPPKQKGVLFSYQVTKR